MAAPAAACTVSVRGASLGRTALIGILLGLTSGVAWGLADFFGGIASRRMRPVSVAALAQVVGMLLIVLAIAIARPTLPPLDDLGLGLLSGVAEGLGVWAFYRALSVGTMSLVAPVSALGAVIPVGVGLVQGERPGALALAGAFVALTGAVLASHAPGEVTRRGLGTAVLAAVGFGVFFVLIKPAAETSVLWAGLSTRVSSVPILLGVCLVVGASFRMNPIGRRLVVAAGALDIVANVAFAAATRHGDLSIVAVLAGLYPVATVLLAQQLLREKLSAGQATGVAVALGGVGMIAAG
jgi:drug/metabolite transporter (DMT)-like permease